MCDGALLSKDPDRTVYARMCKWYMEKIIDPEGDHKDPLVDLTKDDGFGKRACKIALSERLHPLPCTVYTKACKLYLERKLKEKKMGKKPKLKVK